MLPNLYIHEQLMFERHQELQREMAELRRVQDCVGTAPTWDVALWENWPCSWLHSAQACSGLSQNASKLCRS